MLQLVVLMLFDFVLEVLDLRVFSFKRSHALALSSYKSYVLRLFIESRTLIRACGVSLYLHEHEAD